MRLALAICFLAVVAFGQVPPRVMDELLVAGKPKATTASSCTTISQDFGPNTPGTSGWFGTASKKYGGFPIYISNSCSICSISFCMKKGDGAVDYYVSIYSNSDGKPGTMIGGESAAFHFADLTTSFTTNNYPLSSPAAVTANTTNFVVIRTTSVNETPYAYVELDNVLDNPALILDYTSSDGSSWTGLGNNFVLYCRIYK